MLLYLDRSVVEFYMHGRPLSECNCTRDLKLERANIFNQFVFVSFSDNVKYPHAKPVCPFVFADAKLKLFSLYSLIDTFIVKNLFEFQHVDDQFGSINSLIYQFEVKGYNFGLNEKLMFTLIFERVEALTVYGSIGSIQTDLFQSFTHLIRVFFELEELTNFFHRVGIEWTLALQNNCSVTFLYERFDNLWFNGQFYTYPSEDLCIFADWPHQKLIIPFLDREHIFQCTDTMKWIMQNYAEYLRSGR